MIPSQFNHGLSSKEYFEQSKMPWEIKEWGRRQDASVNKLTVRLGLIMLFIKVLKPLIENLLTLYIQK